MSLENSYKKSLHPAFPYPLYLVVSEEFCTQLSYLQVVEQALQGGVSMVQLREKQATSASFLAKAFRVKEITDAYSVPLIINDNLTVAMQVDAAGIHVGNRDISPQEIAYCWPNKLIGYSIEYWQQLQSPAIAYASYLGVSPVFSTATKVDTVTEWGIPGIQAIRKATDLPLVAIGNMQVDNCADVWQAGADSIAVVSALCKAKDPSYQAQLLLNQLSYEAL
ncbi:thiamine phosphate synthase [Sphingobacteriaceae bacterium WQ 2009]|uniref:Thiamine-phosphate synthase n=1 Tax=Rhinopithecimicrobium faecis TaxID=2820698 RepID=A0A8T4HBL0_9SPHI|nr:thiamine phosphate synthase [Sphingobacteriaceae bacterium WQ 2009]